MSSSFSCVCGWATGSTPYQFVHWDPVSLATLDSICSQHDWMCITFFRDPVDRFLSAFHELMKWEVHGFVNQFPELVLAANASVENRTRSFMRFVDLVVANPGIDSHVVPQVRFLQRASGKALAIRGGMSFFNIERSRQVLHRVLAGAVSTCSTHHQPVLFDMDKHDCFSDEWANRRNRSDTSYGLPQYVMRREQLTNITVRTIASLYREDYCFFGIPVPNEARDSIRC